MYKQLKRVLICALMVFFFVLILNGTGLKNALAETDYWNGTAASAFAGGDGTSGNPYQIATAEQLAYLAQQVNTSVSGYNTAYYVLTTDMDLGGMNGYPSQRLHPTSVVALTAMDISFLI